MDDEVSISDAFRAVRENNQQARAARRKAASGEFADAAEIAQANGLTLVRFSEVHYCLAPIHWQWEINIYPGNRRLVGKPGAPFLKLPDEWGLADVVRAAVTQDKFSKS